jgi:hypothetical protein
MNKNRRSKAGQNKLVPTHAPFSFYDPLRAQLCEASEPRKGSLRVPVSGKIIEYPSSKYATAALWDTIEEFTAEILRRALAGEEEAIETFALRMGGAVNRLKDLTYVQREKIERVAAFAWQWPVNVTQRDTDFTWAQKYVRDLKVGSKSLLRAPPERRIRRHQNFARLAESLWLRLLENRHKLPELIEAAGSKNARKLKTEWISRCLSLPAVETVQQVTAQDAPTWWQLGEALLQEAWEQDRQSAFGLVLPEYEGKDGTGKDKYTESYAHDAIFKQFRSAFLNLLGHGRRSKKSTQ